MFHDVFSIIFIAVANAIFLLLAAAGFVRAVWAFTGPKTGRKLEWRGRFMHRPLLNSLWAASLPVYVVAMALCILSQKEPKLTADRPVYEQGFSDAEVADFEQWVGQLKPEDRRIFLVQMSPLTPKERLFLLRRLLALENIGAGLRSYVPARTYEELQLLKAANDKDMIARSRMGGDAVELADLQPYLVRGTQLYETGSDALGHPYGPFAVGENPMVPDATFNALSDVADEKFWSPYK